METFSPDFFDDDDINTVETQKKNLKVPLIVTTSILALTVFFLALGLSVNSLLHPEQLGNPSDEEQEKLISILDEKYPERKNILTQLPYKTIPADLFINAESAILIDQETGNILFEKNADKEIPPASMTKLVEMYVVFEAVKNGEVSLDDIVPLPPESWAINLPSDASIMFLAQGQKVTLRELLLGLAIASGNDASIAVANYVCKDMETFVARMNTVIKEMGLTKTHFVESSGYSEKNITTAKEFAAFCRNYIAEFPESLSDFHSQKVIKYPLEKNLPKEQKHKGDSDAVIQYNTNKLLGLLDGCDGLKTGFIYESGYNISLTAKRGSRRFLSVIMKGPGRGSAQGNKFRIEDGTTLFEFAFSRFAPYSAKETEHAFTLGCAGSEKKSIRLIPALDESFSVPFIYGATPEEAAENIHVTANIPTYLSGTIVQGQQYGLLTYSLDGKTLRTIPLVAETDSRVSNLPGRIWGSLVKATARFFI